MSRVYNFSAGPSMLPETVLKKAAAEMLDYQGSGQSVMEMSHRSKVYATAAGSDGHPGQLQGAVSSGRRFLSICSRPHEPDDQIRQGRLCAVRPILHQSLQGSCPVRRLQGGGLF